jgi:hypothetical protein
VPYVTCTGCRLTAFTAAYRHGADYCERCGAELPRPRTATTRRAAEAPKSDPQASGAPAGHIQTGEGQP